MTSKRHAEWDFNPAEPQILSTGWMLISLLMRLNELMQWMVFQRFSLDSMQRSVQFGGSRWVSKRVNLG